MLNELEQPGELAKYHLFPAAKAYVLRLLGRWEEAVHYYGKAIALAGNEPERRFLEKRQAEAVARQTSA
jgi:RNA polymerase sigma-70 factor (ECF subfamily)